MRVRACVGVGGGRVGGRWRWDAVERCGVRRGWLRVGARGSGRGDEAVDLSFGGDDVDESGVAWRAGTSLLLGSIERGGACARESGLGKSIVLLAVGSGAYEGKKGEDQSVIAEGEARTRS